MAILNVGGMYYDNDPATNTGGSSLSRFGKWLTNRWNDLTGQTAIDKQNEANMQMARYQTQVQEELYKKYSSPEAIINQLRAAGLNPNLAYGQASGGQSNVPGFQAPNVERGLTSSQKFDQALSKMASVLNLKQLVYQTDAQREVAKQSVIKTLHDAVGYKSAALDYSLNSDMLGASISGKDLPGINFVGTDLYNRYIDAYRNSKLSSFVSPTLALANDYGYDIRNMRFLQDFSGAKDIARKQSLLNYEIDQDYKAMLKRAGIAGPLIQGILRILAK